MRIASLVPSATELLFALGLGDSVVAVTHECDFPPAARGLPRLTRTVIPQGLGPAEIDRAVRERTDRGQSLYELDRDALARLDPELIVTQAVCEVCAVSFDDVRTLAAELPRTPAVLSLDPATLEEVLFDARRLGSVAGVEEAAERLVREANARIARVRRAVDGAERPRVAALEWLDPPFVGGHWVPEMVAIAGGKHLLAAPGERSRTVTWEELAHAGAETVLCMPCGYGAARSAQEAAAYRESLSALRAARVVAVDAAAYFSRPGPRLIDGIELLAHVLHPGRVAPPPPGRAIEVDVGSTEPVR